MNTELSLSYDDGFAELVRKTAETKFPTAFGLRREDVLASNRFGPGSMSYSVATKNQGKVSHSRDWLFDIYYNHREAHQDVKDYLDGVAPASCEAYLGLFRSRRTRLDTGKRKHVRIDKHSDDIPVSEVLFVPKDSRGPRTIVRESPHNIRVQMGFFDEFHKALEKDTRGRVQFTEQGVFHELSKTASETRDFCTIDLKDASDRVHARLAAHVFQNCPAFRFVYQNHRSNYASYRGDVFGLTKLAGMGSGMTFPVMAGLIYAAILTYCGDYVANDVWVYGDDIILPSDLYEEAIEALQLIGLQVNSDKSYYRSHFRESCGADWYAGQPVNPVRLRLAFTQLRASGYRLTSKSCVAWTFRSYPPHSCETRPQHNSFVLKLERHCRECRKAGLFKLADYYYSLLEQFLGWRLPLGRGETQYLCRYCADDWTYRTDGAGVYPPIYAFKARPRKRLVLFGLDRSFAAHINFVEDDDFIIPGVFESRTQVDYDLTNQLDLVLCDVNSYALLA
jgi:hypothetical protein